MAARSVANKIALATSQVTVYASPKVGQALQQLVEKLNVYEGVKLGQLLEAVYDQGRKDGARTAFDAINVKYVEALKQVPHRNPGKPKKRKS